MHPRTEVMTDREAQRFLGTPLEPSQRLRLASLALNERTGNGAHMAAWCMSTRLDGSMILVALLFSLSSISSAKVRPSNSCISSAEWLSSGNCTRKMQHDSCRNTVSQEQLQARDAAALIPHALLHQQDSLQSRQSGTVVGCHTAWDV